MDEDISVQMYKRACNSYGIEWANTKTVEDQRLAKLWAWFSSILSNFHSTNRRDVLSRSAYETKFCQKFSGLHWKDNLNS